MRFRQPPGPSKMPTVTGTIRHRNATDWDLTFDECTEETLIVNANDPLRADISEDMLQLPPVRPTERRVSPRPFAAPVTSTGASKTWRHRKNFRTARESSGSSRKPPPLSIFRKTNGSPYDRGRDRETSRAPPKRYVLSPLHSTTRSSSEATLR